MLAIQRFKSELAVHDAVFEVCGTFVSLFLKECEAYEGRERNVLWAQCVSACFGEQTPLDMHTETVWENQSCGEVTLLPTGSPDAFGAESGTQLNI